MIDRKLITTEDGSHSYKLAGMDESYHSVHGAIQESNHVFLEAGLKIISKKEISIFEMGFGTGLNAILSWNYARDNALSINYTCIELYPLAQSEYELINYPDLLSVPREDFLRLHSCPWAKWISLDENFHFHKIKGDIRTFQPQNNFDLVFYDAFSPDVQPDLWKYPIFKQLFDHMNPGAILVSYSVRGDFRRALEKSGFTVKKIPGPPGKRQMTRATKET